MVASSGIRRFHARKLHPSVSAYAVLRGQFQLLTEVDKPTAKQSGTVATIDVEKIQGDQEEIFLGESSNTWPNASEPNASEPNASERLSSGD